VERKLGGKFHLKLNMGSIPISNKYHEGKMKSPLKRKLNVPELGERKADEPFCLARLLRATMNVCCVSVSVVADLHMNARDESSFICRPQRGGEDNALDMVACS
jgi:hypothetical protein